ncbi:MAG: uroporphyrinogen-III synthase [Deltaproteobacteria bacterium]|nr:uroporphyrinogen-III synthase [Deltaproteobacteria bacterium]
MVAQPLAGRKIVVTRARKQAGSLAQRIEALGGEVVELPTIEIQLPEDFTAFDAALARIEKFDWMLFTSVNSIEPFLARLTQVGKTLLDLQNIKIAAVGSATAERLNDAGISLALVPERYQAEGLLEALDAASMSGKRVLIPQAARAREILPETLRSWGAEVEIIEAYRTVAPVYDHSAVKERLSRGEIDIVTFTSSSTVGNFVQLFGGEPLASVVGNAVIASIGPITAKTVEELGGQVAILSRQSTVDGLLEALIDYCASARKNN